jgi:hypothetical protein
MQINFINICSEIALKYFLGKNVVLYEIYSKKSRVANTYVHVLYVSPFSSEDNNIIIETQTNMDKEYIIVEGFTFFPKRQYICILKCGEISWRCTSNTQKCKAKLRTDKYTIGRN